MTKAERPKRTPIATFGRYGGTVNVFAIELDGEPVARVEWREGGRRPTETFRGPKRDRENAAKAYADGVAARLRQGDAPIKLVRLTVGQLWDAYLTAHEPDWRPKTRTLNAQRWRVFTNHVNPLTWADLVQPETLDSWRKALLETNTRTGEPMARNQVAHHIQLVKSVWKFAKGRKLIADNPIAEYAVRKGRDYQPKDIGEFTADEWARILAQLSFRNAKRWRAWAAVALDGLLAPRSNALLNLEWTDVDDARRVVRWRGALDKVGKTREQPLSRQAMMVLRVCRVWARRSNYTGPFVFFGAQDRTRETHWTYSALNGQLRKASERAGVTWVLYRAMHALRRMVAGNVLDVTGDITKVGDVLGDSDMRVLRKSYLKQRPEQLRAVLNQLELPRTTGNETATDATRASADKNPSR